MDREIEKLKREKEAAKSKNRWREVAEMCNYLGHRLSQLHRYEDALEEHREEFKICSTKLSDNLGAAVAYRNMGECYSHMGDHLKAVKYQLGYLKLAEELNNIVEMQRAQTTLGRAYLMFLQSTKDVKKLKPEEEELRMKAPVKCEIAFGEALQLSQRCKGQVQEKEYNQMRCRAYLNLGHLYEELGYLEKCSENYGLAIRISRKFDLKEDLYLCQVGLAIHYENLNRLKEASRLYDEAFLSAKVMKNKPHMHDALIAKATLMLKLRDFVGARRAFKKAYYVRNPIKEDHEKACRYLKLSTLLIQTNNELVKCQDVNQKIKLLEKMGDILAELNCYSFAITYYKQELELAKKDPEFPIKDLASIYLSLGQTYADDGKHKEALEYFLEELSCRCGYEREESSTLLQIAKMKDELGYPEQEVINVYEKALEKAGEDKTPKWIALDHFHNYLKTKDGYLSLKERVKRDFKRLNQIVEATGEESESQEENPPLENEIDINDISGPSSDEESSGPKALSAGGRRARQPKKANDFKLNEVGETPLHRACIEGNLNAVKKLIEKGHPVDIRDYCGWLPLHEAVNHGREEIAKYLVEHGANLNDRGGPLCEGVTPLHDAAANGHIGIMRMLIEKGARVNAVTDRKETVLDCFRGWLNRVKCELDEDETRDARSMERDLEQLIQSAGVDLSSTNTYSNRKRTGKRNLSPDNSNERACKSPTLGPALFRPEDEEMIDFDNPDTARKEYVAAVKSMRRHNSPTRSSVRGFVGSKMALSARNSVKSLLEDRQRVSDDEWLVDDMGQSKQTKKKQSNPFEVGSSTSVPSRRRGLDDIIDFEDHEEARKKPKSPQRRRKKNNEINDFIVNDNEGSDMELSQPAPRSDSYSRREPAQTNLMDIDTHYRRPSPPPLSPPFIDVSDDPFKRVSRGSSAPSGSAFNLRQSDQDFHRDSDLDSAKSSSSIRTSASSSSKFSIRVVIESLTLLVTVPSKVTPVSWLINEVVQRYSKVADCKPLIAMYTLDDALLSPDDLIADAVGEGKALAKIEGWDLPPLAKRYEELCVQTHLIPHDEIINIFKTAEICGRLCVKNLCLPSSHIQVFHKSLLKKNIMEIDFSASNAIYEDVNDTFLAMVSSLKGLNRLLLKNCGLNNNYVKQLFSKISELSISHLDLSYNNLTDDILEYFTQHLEKHPSLIRIDLTGCDINSEKLQDLGQFSSKLHFQSVNTDLIERLAKLIPFYEDQSD